MIEWKNLDTLASFKELGSKEKVSLKDVMSGDSGPSALRNIPYPWRQVLIITMLQRQLMMI